jgi:hypothetical protein
MQSQSVIGICSLKGTVVEGSNCILYVGLFLWQEHQFSLKRTNSTFKESQRVYLCFSAFDSSLLNQKSPYYRKKYANTQSPWAERTVMNGKICKNYTESHSHAKATDSIIKLQDSSTYSYVEMERFLNLLC